MWFCGLFGDLTLKNIRKTGVGMSDWWLLEQVLTQCWHPVASSEALDPLHWAMCVVLYRCIALAIETASKVGVLFDCCFVDCCPGGRWGNMERVGARCQHPVAYRVALDMPRWAMLSVLLRRTTMAIKTAGRWGAFVRHCQFCHQQ